ncbi:arginine-tRNA-protein transferase [Abortiporus biennis]|nr:arginine-tRNA-protein transferase [Abortiporus biennis]
MPPTWTVLSPLPPHNSTCGYCSPPGQRSIEQTNSHAAEAIAQQLTCQDYQDMVDRGWRRSGTYCYKPDLKRSCCPQYTIKLDALKFRPSKSQRKLLNRFNRFIVHGDGHDVDNQMDGSTKPSSKKKAGGKASSKAPAFDLVTAIHASESKTLDGMETAHKFEVTLEPSSFTDEKFNLFKSYQFHIHHEQEKKPSSFSRFLVKSPLHHEPIPYSRQPPEHLPKEYGSYHQMYRLDGQLIAMGVIDILPGCVSSVYFIYEQEWDKLSLGKISALRETSLAREIHDAGVESVKYLYMGFYIHSCPKMRYKGDYGPSYLTDPEDYSWHPLEQCKPSLDKNRYACFSHPEHCIEGSCDDPPPEPHILDADLLDIMFLENPGSGRARIVPPATSEEWNDPESRKAVLTVIDGLGMDVAKRVIFYVV